MSKSWFNRLLLSYMPIFIVVISFTFFVSFQLISEQGRTEAMKANKQLSLQAMRLMDTSLKAIDNMVLQEIINNRDLHDFFAQTEQKEAYVDIRAVKKMNDMISYYPIIDSIYLVRLSDSYVLSNATRDYISTYPDKVFIEQSKDSTSVKWTNLRTFVQFPMVGGKQVVSLVRGAPFMVNNEGMIVVNVAADSLRRMTTDMHDPNYSFIQVRDKSGQAMFSHDIHIEESSLTTDYTSGYTEWQFESGFVRGGMMNIVSMLYNVWSIIGLTMVVLGLIWIVFITRRNSRPVEQMAARFSSYMLPLASGTKRGRMDEFAFIESAIDNVMEQARQFQQQYREDLHLRTRHLFHQLIEDGTTLTSEQWEQEAIRLQLPEPTSRISIFIVEIDKYGEFCNQFSRKDQHLFKFALHSLIQDIASRSEVKQWSEWISASQLSTLVFIRDEDVMFDSQSLLHMADSVRAWTEQNLKFTVTIGIGEPAHQLSDIARSYRSAQEVLNYKMVLGDNRIIIREDISRQGQAEVYSHLVAIRSIVQSFRMQEEGWKEKYDALFTQFKQGLLTKDEIISIMNYFIYHLDREAAHLPSEVKEIWQHSGMEQLSVIIDTFHSLDQMQHDIAEVLDELALALEADQSKLQHAAMIRNMRSFIEHNFNSPNMSLEWLSDEFNINAKYVSRLFKEHTGQKFVDFLIEIRLQEAKRLLRETQIPVQTIAEQVGYTSAISFGRVFKKVTGYSPGEYRMDEARRLNS
ncbi:helix-turn-helix domain-containing protein [Paenibacillus marinisediminis]